MQTGAMSQVEARESEGARLLKQEQAVEDQMNRLTGKVQSTIDDLVGPEEDKPSKAEEDSLGGTLHLTSAGLHRIGGMISNCLAMLERI